MSKARWAQIVQTLTESFGDTPQTAEALRRILAIMKYDPELPQYTPSQRQASKRWLARKQAETGLSQYEIRGEARRLREGRAAVAALAQQATESATCSTTSSDPPPPPQPQPPT